MRFETAMSQFGNNTGIEVPPAVLDELGGGKRPAVVVTVNGYEYRTTVGTMAGKHLLPFAAERRRETGIGGGDALVVDIVLDTAPRETAVPADLATALRDAGIREAFDRLSPSARKAHVTSVESAKAEDTRARRIAAIVAKLS